jgi:hypothetical protein
MSAVVVTKLHPDVISASTSMNAKIEEFLHHPEDVLIVACHALKF